MENNLQHIPRFISFKTNISPVPLPEKFTFPFYYEPHPLCEIAAQELQEHIQNQQEWRHNFGLQEGMDGMVIGKMFGVLVVQQPAGELGYLAAFSGKLAGGNHHAHFVPPVFDMLREGSFFLEGEEELNAYNRRIEQAETNTEYLNARTYWEKEKQRVANEQEQYRQQIKEGKARRKKLRETAGLLSPKEKEEMDELLRKESLKEQYFLIDFLRQSSAYLEQEQQKVLRYENEIQRLKDERKAKSSALQQRLFQEYFFYNQAGQTKSLLDIFQKELQITPPAGAGECAAPKLLQYAFKHNLKPIAMAEFWWGASPASEVRKHGMFYPACRGKCEPILAHMLAGMAVDENPMATEQSAIPELEIVYEDNCLAIVNKPTELLSVPGIRVHDSVLTRVKKKYPEATGPLIVHRLDMSTSGLMLIAKTNEAYLRLQSQFIKRSIKKRYVALLDGELSVDSGMIDLPLRVDLDDRPRQLVCYEYGKPAQTEFNVIGRENGKTRVHFFPITGRTHQLRVHASHVLGLNTPIAGDDLYGNKANRLHLHAEWIEFRHPETNEVMQFTINPNF